MELADNLSKCLFYKKHETELFTNKNVKYELTEELSIDVRLKKNLESPWNCSIVPSLPPKMKILPILARNYKKLDIEPLS